MKPFTTIAIVVFGLLALMQLLRLIMRSELILDGVIVPIWASVIGFVFYAGLAVMFWRETRRRPVS